MNGFSHIPIDMLISLMLQMGIATIRQNLCHEKNSSRSVRSLKPGQKQIFNLLV